MARAAPPAGATLGGLQDQLRLLSTELNEGFLRERTRRQGLEGRVARLESGYRAAIETLAFVVEAKDCYTRDHLERTYEYALALSERVDPALAADEELGYGFLLHDVGKIGVPESVLGKPGPLTEEEWAVMRTHPELGVSVCAALDFLGRGVAVIRHHHERWDGRGYPDGLGGDDIPTAARIFGVVDTFDAMTSDRPYRAALPVDVAVTEIARGAGSQFDPTIVEEFLGLCEDGLLHLPA